MNTKKLSLVSTFVSTLMLSTVAFAVDNPSRATSMEKLNDSEIASIVVAANTVDINAGKLAEKRSSNSQVQAFAKKMESDHTSVNKQATDLVTKLGVTPRQNEISRKLTSDGENALERLRGLEGAAFDKAYIDNEVAYHQEVIDMVQSRLIPEATNEELKNLLVKVSPTFVEHLNHAKSLQAELNKVS